MPAQRCTAFGEIAKLVDVDSVHSPRVEPLQVKRDLDRMRRRQLCEGDRTRNSMIYTRIKTSDRGPIHQYIYQYSFSFARKKNNIEIAVRLRPSHTLLLHRVHK
jgi:hypothetical protein